MSCKLRTRTLIKSLVVVYISSIFVILSKLQMEQPMENQRELFEKLRKLHAEDFLNKTATPTPQVVVVIRNISRLVYVNKTHVQYKFRDRIPPRYGPGENGTNVPAINVSLSAETRNITETHRQKHGFNTLVSDTVSLHRKLPDLRPQECKDIVYPDNLPAISIVIIFRDEWPSILLRTAYSVLENSPPELIKEVVLVNDGSLDEHLKMQVEVHVAAVEKFKLVTHKQALGLMLARQRGIEATTAEYFAVMDGHMEVSPGWLEPLLFRLVQEPNALLCSHVGKIDQENFGFFIDKNETEDQLYNKLFPLFDPLTLDQEWAEYRTAYRAARNTSMGPLEYGTIQGMMVVMRKEFFLRLGGFDPGMKIWGAEQIELSVKVWMCGGRVEMIPCSKVLHMYRLTIWSHVKTQNNYYSANKRRMIDVWLDEPYRGFVMDYINGTDYQFGDITDRLRIRMDNKCKPYAFFVNKVVELTDMFWPINVRQKGVIYNAFFNQCLDLTSLNEMGKFKLGLYHCHGNSNQYFVLSQHSQIRSAGFYMINVLQGNSTEIIVQKSVMNIYDENSYWQYTPDTSILNKASDKCLTIMPDYSIQLFKCHGNIDQFWKWGPLK